MINTYKYRQQCAFSNLSLIDYTMRSRKFYHPRRYSTNSIGQSINHFSCQSYQQPPQQQIFHESQSEDDLNPSTIAEPKILLYSARSKKAIQLHRSPASVPDDFEQVCSAGLDNSPRPSIQQCLNHQPANEKSKYQQNIQRSLQPVPPLPAEALYHYPSFESDESHAGVNQVSRNDHKGQEAQLMSNSTPMRKVRTMITEQKLVLMNVVFQNYEDNTSDTKSKQQKIGRLLLQKLKREQPGINQAQIANIQSLKAAGKLLNLAYSTVLHKYKQFRQNKHVKGGSRMLSKYFKQKYKKSYQIESYIAQALAEQPFYTALQLSKYICHKYGVYYPRCNINRHLAEMGFNLSMNPPYMKKLNTKEVKEVRLAYVKTFSKLSNEVSSDKIVYVDEFLFQKDRLTLQAKRQLIQNVSNGESSWLSDDYASLLIAVSQAKVVYYQIKKGIYTKADFNSAVERISFGLDMLGGDQRKVIVLDLHPIHVPEKTERNQQTKDNQDIVSQHQFRKIYLPPYSPELNPCLPIFMQIQSRLARYGIKKSYGSKNSLPAQLEETLTAISSCSTGVYFQSLAKWHQKAMFMESF